MTAPAAEAFQITTATRGVYYVEIAGVKWDTDEKLTETAWFGDEALALEVAEALDSVYWDFLEDQGFSSTTFIFVGATDLGVAIDGSFTTGRGVLTGTVGKSLSGSAGWVREISPTATAIPSPAAVLPGLLGIGFSAIRKRSAGSSENA